MSRASVLLLHLALLSCGSAGQTELAAAGPAVTAVPPAPSTPAPPAAALDARLFDKVLSAHVRGGLVDYAALKADARARKQLDDFLAAVAVMPDSAPLAAWLNAYNALVIKLALERYPLKSVMDVPDFFKALKLPVAGKPRSLDQIEHEVIRPRFKDARVHVALNCGALSCPPLRAKAFVEASLDADLDALARRTVADPRHVSLRGGKLRLSEIFFWFEQDFVRDAGSVVAWIRRYAQSPELRGLPDGLERVKRKYDWTLADASKR